MATPTAEKRGPRVVKIRYESGRPKGQELVVTGYPPEDLQKNQEIVFEPEPSGTLELTFKYGSNFAIASEDGSVGLSKPIKNQELQKVERLEMTDAEFNAFKAEKEAERWSLEELAQLKKNAFPFMCKLTVPGVADPYKGGFPSKPGRP
jgi:hypothetical protein